MTKCQSPNGLSFPCGALDALWNCVIANMWIWNEKMEVIFCVW